jgi:hypothetical protein
MRTRETLPLKSVKHFMKIFVHLGEGATFTKCGRNVVQDVRWQK